MSHSSYPLSGSSRWLETACPASIRMSKRYKQVYKTNYAAEEGTAAHDLREFCLRLGVNPQDCIGMKFNRIEVNQEMVDGVTIDVNYVNRLSIEYGVKPLIEQRVTMSSLGRLDVFGTADTTFLVPNKRLIHTLDFKYGRNLVEVEDNSQLDGYGVSTLDTFKLWGSIDTIKESIIQPRYAHVKGPIRTVTKSIDDLDKMADVFYRSIQLADNPETEPKAGTWCKYCPARSNCRARMLKTLEIAYRVKSVDDISDEEIELLMLELPATKSHLDDLESEARKRALQGSRFNNFKLVESRPRKKCTDEKHLIKEASEAGINVDRLFDKKLKSFSGAKKIIPESMLNKYYVSPPSSDVLVKMSDKRVAKIAGSVQKGTFGKIKK